MIATIEDIHKLRDQALADFVRKRLAGVACGPSISVNSDDSFEDILVDAYRTGSEEFQVAMDSCALDWLRKVESGESDATDPGFARLLVLIGSVPIIATHPFLACLLFKNKDKWQQMPGCYAKSLLHELMLALREMPMFQSLCIWVNYLCEPGLEAIAFGGIADVSVDQALAYLPIVVGQAIKEGNPDLLRTCLVYFLALWAKKYPERDVVQEILIVMRRPEPSNARQFMIDTLLKLSTTRATMTAKLSSSVPMSSKSSISAESTTSAADIIRRFGRGLAIVGK